MLISATEDDKSNKLRVWDVQSGLLNAMQTGGRGSVAIPHYNSDGQVLASASWDKAFKLWDAQAGLLKNKGYKPLLRELSGYFSSEDHTLASGKLWTPDLLQTQALFYQYDPKHVSNALKFLWEMGLDDDKLEMVHKVRTPTLYPLQGRYYADTQYLPLLEFPAKGKTKADQLMEWLEEDHKARQKKLTKTQEIQ